MRDGTVPLGPYSVYVAALMGPSYLIDSSWSYARTTQYGFFNKVMVMLYRNMKVIRENESQVLLEILEEDFGFGYLFITIISEIFRLYTE